MTVNREMIAKLADITMISQDLVGDDLRKAYERAKEEYDTLAYTANGKLRAYERKLKTKATYEAKVLSEQGNVDAYQQVVDNLPDGDIRDQMNSKLLDAQNALRKATESLSKNGTIPLRLAEIELAGLHNELVAHADKVDSLAGLVASLPVWKGIEYNVVHQTNGDIIVGNFEHIGDGFFQDGLAGAVTEDTGHASSAKLFYDSVNNQSLMFNTGDGTWKLYTGNVSTQVGQVVTATRTISTPMTSPVADLLTVSQLVDSDVANYTTFDIINKL